MTGNVKRLSGYNEIQEFLKKSPIVLTLSVNLFNPSKYFSTYSYSPNLFNYANGVNTDTNDCNEGGGQLDGIIFDQYLSYNLKFEVYKLLNSSFAYWTW